jgi:hypothetical protein
VMMMMMSPEIHLHRNVFCTESFPTNGSACDNAMKNFAVSTVFTFRSWQHKNINLNCNNSEFVVQDQFRLLKCILSC